MKSICIVILCAGMLSNCFAQEYTVMLSGSKGQRTANNQYDNLPDEYRGIKLGMPIDAVKNKLKKDSIFGYRGDTDVSLLLTENRSLIETAGSHFLRRAWLQFYHDNLYSMIFKLNTDAVDYYSIYRTFCEKYGDPLKINPVRAVWENGQVRVVIERPLVVKYIDLTVFNELLHTYSQKQTNSEMQRNDFIDSF